MGTRYAETNLFQLCLQNLQRLMNKLMSLDVTTKRAAKRRSVPVNRNLYCGCTAYSCEGGSEESVTLCDKGREGVFHRVMSPGPILFH